MRLLKRSLLFTSVSVNCWGDGRPQTDVQFIIRKYIYIYIYSVVVDRDGI